MLIGLELAFISGALMLAGYALYIGLSLKHDIEPNPTTWLMFSYGTALLTFFEGDTILKETGWAAGWPLLVVPIACTIGGIIVACVIRFRQKKRMMPVDRADKVSFYVDLALTLGYIITWTLLAFQLISEEMRGTAVLAFLVLSNLSAVPAFVPIFRSTRKDPRGERALPWLVWTASYATLIIVTYNEVGVWSVLMIYPVLNTVLHGTMASLSLPHRRSEKERHEEQKEIELEIGFKRFGDLPDQQEQKEPYSGAA
jgi:hypothetical protein